MQNLLEAPQLWGLIGGLVLPALIATVQQPHWSKLWRTAIAVGVSAISGTIAVLAAGDLDPTNWITTVVAVIVASEAAYKKLWQPSGKASKIEYATSGYGDPEVDFHAEVPDTEDDPSRVELEDDAPESGSPV